MLSVESKGKCSAVVHGRFRQCEQELSFELQGKGEEAQYDMTIHIFYKEAVSEGITGNRILDYAVIKAEEEITIAGEGGEHYDFWEELSNSIYDAVRDIVNKVFEEDFIPPDGNDVVDEIFNHVEHICNEEIIQLNF
jgi:hypothetical protein